MGFKMLYASRRFYSLTNEQMKEFTEENYCDAILEEKTEVFRNRMVRYLS